MNIKRIYNCIVSMLCIVMLLGTSQVFALSSGKAPDGSVNIIPPDTAARLQFKVTGSGAKLSALKLGLQILPIYQMERLLPGVQGREMSTRLITSWIEV